MIISANNFLLIKVLFGAMFAKHVLIALKWGVCVVFFLQGIPGDQLSLSTG